ncbi:hypothetical protein L228DRAFT_262279 [Xylona heveae TC161]|uniref:Endoplasmic reticulum junction formation protein lunapark n=1 Tax=Xylona heveae (strain CBS 132557 / TC161) TaxID=1328760 RepID=A0A165FPT8_XYLHT|nr:hypothetical protein L228DRAFT_262279 [Xylona heveae TC161]KZF21239.1 hypothetical protein L228DRAFT_262279 [Xylona heveae TC161]
MVSLWPWRGENNSPASFEKTLSSLSGKVSNTSARLDSLRQRSRRDKVLWTLYTLFAYILSSIILVFVIGWDRWGPSGYTAVAGGPVIIYLGRLLLTTYYEYRISRVQASLDALEKQRDTTIEKLKAATKYNTTQQLLEKYGSPPARSSKPPAGPEGPKKRRGKGAAETPNSPKGGRVGIVPPPTANIPRNNAGQPTPITPQRPLPDTKSPPMTNASDASFNLSSSAMGASFRDIRPGAPEFAPNAFPTSAQDASALSLGGPKWYDRILDLLLGEDETQPKNRLALVCRHCKLVNGLAPPGAKRQEDVGMWKCSNCGGKNWEESEAKKIVAAAEEEAKEAMVERQPSVGETLKSGDEDSQSDTPASPSGSVDDPSESEDIKVASEEELEAPKTQTKKGRSKVTYKRGK